MLKKYLEILSNNDVEIIRGFIKILYKNKYIYINPAIFDSSFDGNLIEYKKYFINKITVKKNNLKQISEEVKKGNTLTGNDLVIFNNELNILLEKANFLINIYDIEANKLDSEYKITNLYIDYEYYNNKFFNTSKLDINNSTFKLNKSYEKLIYSKLDLIKLLNFTKSIVPSMDYEFGKFGNLSHYNGTLRIPEANEYNIRTIIVIFFHEMTHFFRYLNGVNNLGFNYSFSDYGNFEEGLANYNEIKYGNQIIDYGDFIPYYNICFSVLKQKISNDEKIKKVYQILKNKGFDKKKSKSYFYRFYKFSQIGGEEFFLKDLIYSKSYNLISNYLQDFTKYDKLMAGKIGLSEYNNNLVLPLNNFDSISFFEEIKNEILKLSKDIGLKF